MTKQYGILANPAKHSVSPVMHNAAFEDLGIDAKYNVFEIEEKELGDFMKNLKENNVYGLSVSLPYKEKILKYIDTIDDDAKKIGAVNTVIRKNNSLYGYNTDHFGVASALKETYGDLRESISVVIGAGGAARAAAYGLLMAGGHVWIQNRSKEKADKIAVDFAELFDSEIHSDEWGAQGTGDILIHATSLWHNDPPSMPFFCEPEYIECFDTVMDLSYTPLITPLLRISDKLKRHIVPGDRMLLWQGVKQFELWTGKEAPFEAMEDALERAFKK